MHSSIINGDRPSALDVSLLGLIATIVGGYGRSISVPPDTAPHLIRFFSVSPDRSYAAVMPQDKALLLLSDPATGEATRQAAGAGGSLHGIWTLVAFLGLLLLFAGPAIVWLNHGDD